MEKNDLIRTIGKVTYSSIKIKFLLANIALELNVVSNYLPFDIERDMDKLLSQILNRIKTSLINGEYFDQFSTLFANFLKHHKETNRLIYSGILNNDDEYYFHIFPNSVKLLSKLKLRSNSNEISSLNEQLITLNNDIHTLWNDFQKSRNLSGIYNKL